MVGIMIASGILLLGFLWYVYGGGDKVVGSALGGLGGGGVNTPAPSVLDGSGDPLPRGTWQGEYGNMQNPPAINNGQRTGYSPPPRTPIGVKDAPPGLPPPTKAISPALGPALTKRSGGGHF